tara:strand:- start:55022 stop:55249 length:228 start_codon:yes stop_codon:yes gene_type:complete
MQVGDLVMFNNPKSKYAKWFFGQFGIVKSYSEKQHVHGFTRHCRVVWLQPVKYFDGFSKYSDFSAGDFEVCNEAR